MAIVKSWSGLNGHVTALVELEMADAFEYDPRCDQIIRLISISPNLIPTVLAIYVNPPYTTVKWGDGTVTTVKCCEDDTYSEAQGFAAALAKKLYGGKHGSSSHVKKFVASHAVRKAKKSAKKEKKKPDLGENSNAAQ